MIAGMNSLGEFFDAASGAATTVLIDSVTDNPAAGNGVILRSVVYDMINGNSKAILRAGTNQIESVHSETAGSNHMTHPLELPLFIEAGIAVDVVTLGASTAVTLSWDKVQ